MITLPHYLIGPALVIGAAIGGATFIERCMLLAGYVVGVLVMVYRQK